MSDKQTIAIPMQTTVFFEYQFLQGEVELLGGKSSITLPGEPTEDEVETALKKFVFDEVQKYAKEHQAVMQATPGEPRTQVKLTQRTQTGISIDIAVKH